MNPISSNTYVPVLVAKMGEAKSLKTLRDHSADTCSHIVPMFVAPPVEMDYEAGKPKKSAPEQARKVADLIGGCWVGSAFLDGHQLLDGGRGGAPHALEAVMRQAAQQGIDLVPVVSVVCSDAYLEAVARVLAPMANPELCIRMAPSQWPSQDEAPGLSGILKRFGLTPEQVHLMLDLGAAVAAETSVMAGAAELRHLQDLDRWRSVILAGAGMPDQMPTGKGIHEIDRTDWEVYTEVRRRQASNGLREPSFSDYAVAGPNLVLDIDPRLMSISATIRYTTEDRWLIAKGDLFKGPGGRSQGGGAAVDAAVSLKAHGLFAVEHCATEKWVADVAAGAISGGNPTTWRTQGTFHHLVVVTQQLARTYGL